MLLLHILIACSGLAFGSYNLARPHRSLFVANYLFLAATIISGTYLTIVGHGPILSTCISGLVYTFVMLALQYGARVRLAHQQI